MGGVVERWPLAVGLAVLGWLLGGLSAWVTSWLEGAPRRAGGGVLQTVLAGDRLVQSCVALVWAVAGVWLAEPWWRALAAGLVALPLIQVAVTDYRTRFVYTLYAAGGAVLGLALGWLVHGGPWWSGLLGAAGGFLVFSLLYWVGRLLFRTEAMAQGDITIATLVGAGAAVCTPQALFYGVLIGGLVGAGLLLFRRRFGMYMPYGPGLCLGGLVALLLC
jgi:prepilin signal peptidase PulO-like enzyme (type II secretory pathway)